MSPLDVADNQDTERASTPYVPPLQRTVLLPILPRCPDEHGDDDAGAEQSHHGNQNSQRNGGENGRAPRGHSRVVDQEADRR